MSEPAFGRYEVVEELGRGTMGVVYRAQDPAIGRNVAIKAINRAYLQSVGVKPEEYAERFQREAQVAGALNHPHIVKIFDLGPDHLVMEYVEGRTLAAILRAEGRLPREAALRILRETADALDHAHAAGVIHRDIKPANVIVQPGGAVKVMDFGLARVESSTLTAAGEVLGSAAYMAPEVVLGQTADTRSDIFSLAVMAYELITGSRPFTGPTVSAIIHNVVRRPPRPVLELDGTLPRAVDGVFLRALNKEPGQRYASARELVQALADVDWGSAAAGSPARGAKEAPGDATMVMAVSPLPAGGGLPEDLGAGTMLTVEADELAEPVESAATLILERPVGGSGQAAPPAAPASATDVAPVGTATTRMPALAAATAETIVMRASDAAAQPPTVESSATVRLPVTQAGEGPRPPVEAVKPVPESPATVRLRVDPPGGAEAPARAAAPEPEPALTVRLTADQAGLAGSGSARTDPSHTVRLPVAAVEPAGSTAAVATPARAAATPGVGAAPSGSAPAAPGARRGGRSSLPLVLGAVAVVVVGLATSAGVLYWLVARRGAAAPPPTVADAEAPGVDEPARTASDAEQPPHDVVETPATPPADTPAQDPAPEAPAPATLLVTSEPPGAAVSVARRARGKTPLSLNLPAGTVAVVVELEGFEPWRRSTRLDAGKTHRLVAALSPVPSPVRSPPPSAAPEPARVREGDLVPLGPDVVPPRKLSGTGPNLPRGLRRSLTGSTLVEFTVNVDGSVGEAEVLESLGAAVDKVVLATVAEWRYEPAHTQGVRVRVRHRAKFTFVRE